MALAGTLTHRKTRKLARLMGCSMLAALGAVEGLLHVTAARTPDGAIGRLSNQDIADELFWDEDADALIENYIAAGFIDRDPTHRLVVHDWSEHADDVVHSRLARKRLWFSDGTEPRLTRLNSTERIAATAFYAQGRQAQTTEALPAPLPEDSGSTPGVATSTTETVAVAMPSLAMPCHASLPQPPTERERECGGSESPEPDEASNGHKPNRFFGALEEDFLVRTIRGDEWLQVEEQLDRWHKQGYRVGFSWFREACVEARADCKEKTGKFPRSVTWLINHLTELIGDMEPRNAH